MIRQTHPHKRTKIIISLYPQHKVNALYKQFSFYILHTMQIYENNTFHPNMHFIVGT